MRIKHLSKLLSLCLAFTLCFLTACGGGGGGGTTPAPEPQPQPQPQVQAQRVTATLSLQGSASTTVGSVDLSVLLPDGFVLEADNLNQPTASALAFLVTGATAIVNYTPATIVANGELKAGIIKSDGFTGNSSLMQISRTYAAGATLPTANDFMVTVIASDLNGATLTGISELINVSTQPAP